jgi:hypothetical protein
MSAANTDRYPKYATLLGLSGKEHFLALAVLQILVILCSAA